MRYSRGINYQLEGSESVHTELYGYEVIDEYYCLLPGGRLVVSKGYAWDGASGGVDTGNVMRASLFHDVLSQMMGNDQLPMSVKDDVNQLYYEVCRADGMSWLRAKWQLKAIQLHFRFFKPHGDRKIYEV
jgi:hypothetical protein